MWLIHEGNIYGIRLCYWIKVRYGSADELDTLKCFYGQKIRSLQLEAVGLLIEYIDQFQGLEILWKEIDCIVEPEDRLVTQMVKYIEYPFLSGPCEPGFGNTVEINRLYC